MPRFVNDTYREHLKIRRGFLQCTTAFQGPFPPYLYRPVYLHSPSRRLHPAFLSFPATLPPIVVHIPMSQYNSGKRTNLKHRECEPEIMLGF